MTHRKKTPREIREERAQMIARLLPSKAEHWSVADKIREAARTGREVAEQRIEIKSLVGQVAGFIPTPHDVVIRMIGLADIRAGMQVLEPGAGAGAIADEIRKLDCFLTTIEVNPSLCNILWKKGYQTRCMDFLDHVGMYDRILANFPFENLQDIEHCKHAYNLLVRGGRMVVIMGVGPFFRTDRRSAVEFREWFNRIGGESKKLPRDTFTLEGASVGARLVVIDK